MLTRFLKWKVQSALSLCLPSLESLDDVDLVDREMQRDERSQEKRGGEESGQRSPQHDNDCAESQQQGEPLCQGVCSRAIDLALVDPDRGPLALAACASHVLPTVLVLRFGFFVGGT
jgi:hypothetical protein